MIFHVPFELDPDSAVGNDVRPVKMLAAFRSLGYEVDVVHGRNRERKIRAAAVRQKIDSGVKYSFVYSESSCLPTGLTDPSKKPTHPLFDLAFLRFCRENEIKVGLFYRDVHWRFPTTGQYKSGFRYAVLLAFHLFDVAAYNSSISKMYLPSMAMRRFIPLVSKIDAAALPPAHDVSEPAGALTFTKPLHLLYIGGLGAKYDLRTFMEVVHSMPNIHFTLCTREADWHRKGASYEKLLGDNVSIVHEKGEDLGKLYANADVGVYFLKPIDYSEFAVSLKIFEYIGNRLPIIAVKGTQVGSIVDGMGVGWTLPFEAEPLRDLLARLSEHPHMIADLSPQLAEVSKANTWLARARTVAQDLSC